MTAWLSCRATRGMFPHEVAVLVHTADGRCLSFFLPRTLVQLAQEPSEAETQAKISVEVLREEGRDSFVRLPGDPFEGSRVTRVRGDLLAAA